MRGGQILFLSLHTWGILFSIHFRLIGGITLLNFENLHILTPSNICITDFFYLAVPTLHMSDVLYQGCGSGSGRIRDFFSSWIRIRIQESQICQKLFIFEQNFNKFHGENWITNPDPDPGFFQLLDPDPDPWKYFRSDPDPGKNFPDPKLW